MPSAVLSRLDAVCDIDLHTGPNGLSHEALCARVLGKKGLICVFTDRVDAATIASSPCETGACPPMVRPPPPSCRSTSCC